MSNSKLINASNLIYSIDSKIPRYSDNGSDTKRPKGGPHSAFAQGSSPLLNQLSMQEQWPSYLHHEKLQSLLPRQKKDKRPSKMTEFVLLLLFHNIPIIIIIPKLSPSIIYTYHQTTIFNHQPQPCATLRHTSSAAPPASKTLTTSSSLTPSARTRSMAGSTAASSTRST